MPVEESLIATTKPCLNDPGWKGTPTITIDVDRLIETRMLAEANSGGGKSYGIRRILEQTYGKAQHIVIDVEGEFHTLRELYDYVLCAPRGGDCVADLRSAQLLARRLLELGCSAIIDISELGAQQTRFVKLFLESLMSAPRDLWHSVIVVVDEAHKFCPEKDQAESEAAVIDLMTRGRKRGFCGVLATQRLSKLNKDAAAEANNLLIGRTALDLDITRAATVLGTSLKEARAILPKLEPGEFFCVGPALSPSVERIRIGHVKTSHPRAGTRGAPPTPPRAHVKAILAKLADLPAEAEEEQKTMTELRAKVRELEAKLKSTDKIDTTTIDELSKSHDAAVAKIHELMAEVKLHRTAKVQHDQSMKAWRFLSERVADMRDTLSAALTESLVIEGALGLSFDDGQKAIKAAAELNNRKTHPIDLDPKVAAALTNGKHVQNKPKNGRELQSYAGTSEPYKDAGAVDVFGQPEATRKGSSVRADILRVLAQRGGELPKRKVLIYARRSRSGATDKAFAELVAEGLLNPAGAGGVALTPKGRAEVGVVSPLDPVVRDFTDMERAFLIVLATYDRLGVAMTKTRTMMFAGYQRSGATDKAWARLSANDWIETTDHNIRISTDGLEALGPYDPAPYGVAFRAKIRGELGAAAGAFFDYLCTVPDNFVDKKAVLAKTGYKRSGATDEAFALLVRRGYAIKGKSGDIAVSPELFFHG